MGGQERLNLARWRGRGNTTLNKQIKVQAKGGREPGKGVEEKRRGRSDSHTPGVIAKEVNNSPLLSCLQPSEHCSLRLMYSTPVHFFSCSNPFTYFRNQFKQHFFQQVYPRGPTQKETQDRTKLEAVREGKKEGMAGEKGRGTECSGQALFPGGEQIIPKSSVGMLCDVFGE